MGKIEKMIWWLWICIIVLSSDEGDSMLSPHLGSGMSIGTPKHYDLSGQPNLKKAAFYSKENENIDLCQ